MEWPEWLRPAGEGEDMIVIDERLMQRAVTAHGSFLVSKLVEEALDRIIRSGSLEEAEPGPASGTVAGEGLHGTKAEIEEASATLTSALHYLDDVLDDLRAAEAKQKRLAA